MRRFTCLVETFLVATRDVLSFALVYPDSFPAESTCVSFWLAQCELCGCCCSAQCDVLCESCPAHQVPVFPPCCCVSSSCARDCVFLTRDMACITAQENLMCPSHPAQKKTNKTPRQHGSRWCSAGSVLCGDEWLSHPTPPCGMVPRSRFPRPRARGRHRRRKLPQEVDRKKVRFIQMGEFLSKHVSRRFLALSDHAISGPWRR